MQIEQHVPVRKTMSDIQDLLHSREAADAARTGCLFAQAYVQDTLQACANHGGWAQVSYDV